MAQKVREIKISWENQDSFKMQTRLDGGNWLTIIETDENGHLATLWNSGIELLCKTYFDEALKVIGSEMKAGG